MSSLLCPWVPQLCLTLKTLVAWRTKHRLIQRQSSYFSWTGKLGMLQSTGSQSQARLSNWTTPTKKKLCIIFNKKKQKNLFVVPINVPNGKAWFLLIYKLFSGSVFTDVSRWFCNTFPITVRVFPVAQTLVPLGACPGWCWNMACCIYDEISEIRCFMFEVVVAFSLPCL